MTEKLSMKDRAMGCVVLFAFFGVLSLVFWGCSAVFGDDEPVYVASGGDARPSLSGEDDASAREACRHFRNVARDASDGILTSVELREKFREVDGMASVSGNSTVSRYARELLVNATQGRDMSDSIYGLGAACRGIGQ